MDFQNPRIFAGGQSKIENFCLRRYNKKKSGLLAFQNLIVLEFQGPSPQIPDIPYQKSKFKVKNTKNTHIL